MKLEMKLKHGEAGKQDVRIELTNEVLVVREYDSTVETREHAVRLDRWQIRQMTEVLNFWLTENDE